jgi:hypothetical protein
VVRDGGRAAADECSAEESRVRVRGREQGEQGDAGGAGVRLGFRYAVRIRDKRPAGGAAQRWL